VRTVYVVGYPGSGKSTLVGNTLTALGAMSAVQVDAPVPHLRYNGIRGVPTRMWEIGRRRDSFSGTDALAMNIQPKAVAWVSGLNDGDAVSVLFGEGDRLANLGFLTACPELILVHLDVPVAVAQARAAQRAAHLGRSPQNDSWWKGRVTKTKNLISMIEGVREVVRIDGMTDPVTASEQLVNELAERVR